MIRGILLLVIFLNIFLAFFILSNNSKSINHRLFALMGVLAALWTFMNYITGVSTSLFWLQSAYAAGSLVITSAVFWIMMITETRLYKYKILLLSSCTLIFCLGSFLPGFIAKSYDQIYSGTIFLGGAGWGLTFFATFYFTLSFYILYKLFIFQRNVKDLNRKYQIRYIFIGSLISLIITALSSFILPYFSIFLFGGVDNVGFLLFLVMVTFAITKYHLFNIKIIAIEMVVFLLWAFLFLRVLFSSSWHEAIPAIILFITSLILGILLVQNVLQGIQQRKDIEQLTKEIMDVPRI